MYPLNQTLSWGDALAEYVLHLSATRAEKTVRFDRVQVTQLIRWAESEGIALQDFGKRHMDRYTVHRREQGKARMTLRHDGVCAKKFLAWCHKNDLIEVDRLAGYEVHNAPKPPRHMPSAEEVAAFLEALPHYWNPDRNPGVREMPPAARQFHRERNVAIFLGLLDNGARIGEMLSLKVSDYVPAERKAVFRHTKGKEQRAVPVSPEWAEALASWLKVRARVMRDVPPEEDAGWLFISDNGGPIDPLAFIKTLHRITGWAGLPKLILHDFRRFSINAHVKDNPMQTQYMVGHKDPKTTYGYTKLGVEDIRKTQERAGLLRSVMSAKKSEKRKRLV